MFKILDNFRGGYGLVNQTLSLNLRELKEIVLIYTNTFLLTCKLLVGK